MNPINLEYRMYGMVPYNLSDIQKGIQFGHAVVEYANEHSKTNAYKKWSRYDKTFIILNGGTTNNKILSDGLPSGTLNQHELKLLGAVSEMPVARFCEPDLGDQLTAICFLVDERVWNREKYPDFELDKDAANWDSIMGGRTHGEQFDDWKMQFSDSETEADHIIWLRDFLRSFKLA